jgi:hypothetical protein
MATYVNDLRLKEISTGDESGTWGTSTNTNLELIAEAFSFGTEAITTNADTHTTTIADGSTDPGRSMFLKYTGTLDSACTITIGPNTVSKLWFIENATSGSQSIIIKQGSGATITIANGQVKAIYSDGAGSGAAMVDAFTDLSVPSFFVSGDLDVDGTTNLDVVDIDGALTQDGGAVFNEASADVDFRVESDANTHALFVEGSSSNVGIGTSSPNRNLHIIGAYTVENSAGSPTGALLFIPAADANRIYSRQSNSSTSSRDLAFVSGSSEAMRISGGNVGIGTDSPNRNLHVSGGAADVAFGITNSASGTSASDGFSITLENPTPDVAIRQRENANMKFLTNNTERMRIDSSGNVEVKGGQELRVYRGDNATYGSMKYLTGSGGLQLNDKNGDGISFVKADGATEYGRFDASGNLGIGTSSPSSYHAPADNLVIGSSGDNGLTIVSGTSSGGTICFADGTSGGAQFAGFIDYQHNGDYMRFGTNVGTEAMRIDSSGRVGIGTASPSSYYAKDLVVSAVDEGGITIAGGSTDQNYLMFAEGTSGSETYRGYIGYDHPTDIMQMVTHSVLRFYNGTSSSEMGRFDSDSKFLVGTTGASFGERMTVNSNSASYSAHLFATSGATAPLICRNQNGVSGSRSQIIFYYDSSAVGSITSTASATGYGTSSDQRLKSNIEDADDAGSKVDAIQVRKFDWKVDGSHQDYGMVAQELQSVAPEAVTGDAESDEMMAVDYSKLVPMLVKEIQSLRTRVAQLENN